MRQVYTTKWNDTDRPCDLCHLSVSFRFAFRMFAREIATIHVQEVTQFGSGLVAC